MKKEVQKSERIIAIDLLRGFFMLAIIAIHLGRFPSGYDFITGRGLLWVSSAEGFFFMSGLLIGIVRGRKAQEIPFSEIAKKQIKRAIILYVWTVGLTIFFTFIALKVNNNYVKPGAWSGTLNFDFVYQSLIFKYVYSWADFLQYYSVYLLFSVPVIYLLRKNKTVPILALTTVVWIFWQGNAFANWQLFFFVGTICGWHWENIIKTVKKIPKWVINFHYPFFIVTLILSVIIVEGSLMPKTTELLAPYFSKVEMPPPRVAIFALWFSAGYRFVSTYAETIIKWAGWILIPFGQYSLYVYIVHSFLVFFTGLFIPLTSNPAINFVIITGVLITCLAAVKNKFLFGLIPR